MLCDKNQPLEIPTNPQQNQEVEEEELLLLQETATMDCSSFFDDPTTTNTTARFSNLHLTNHPPCSTCGCNGTAPSSSSSASLKRSSSESFTLQPNPKRPNINSNSFFGFSKIPFPTTTNSSSLSAPAPNTSPSRPFLRRCMSDLCDPLPTNVAAENPQSPPSQNVDVACPETPLSAARTSKLPPRPPTLRRSVSDPTPSPAQTFSSSCNGVREYNSPNTKWARKMHKCMKEMTRKWDELLGFEEDKGGEESKNKNNSNSVENNENCEEECVEAVTVEKSGECLIINFKCPCGRGYQLLLSGKNCYYKLM